MDKDRFRQGMGGLKVAYEEVLKRILNNEEATYEAIMNRALEGKA